MLKSRHGDGGAAIPGGTAVYFSVYYSYFTYLTHNTHNLYVVKYVFYTNVFIHHTHAHIYTTPKHSN